jgi:drug/metabolite transporter (DMT)-like permease
MNTGKNNGKPYTMLANGYLLIQVVIWGFSFIVNKSLFPYMSVSAFVALRFLLAAAALAPFYFKKVRAALNLRFVMASVILGLLAYLSVVLQLTGLKETTVTNSAFITSMTVILVPFAERILLKKNVHAIIWAGCFLAFAGALLLTGGFTLQFNTGDILTFASTVFIALHMVLSAKYVQTMPSDTLGFSYLAVAAVLSAAAWGAAGFEPPAVNLQVIMGIAYTSILGIALGYMGQTIALKYTLPSVASLVYALEPVFASFFAAVIPDAGGRCEVLNLKVIAGAAIIFAGVLLALFSPYIAKKNKPTKENNSKTIKQNT